MRTGREAVDAIDLIAAVTVPAIADRLVADAIEWLKMKAAAFADDRIDDDVAERIAKLATPEVAARETALDAVLNATLIADDAIVKTGRAAATTEDRNDELTIPEVTARTEDDAEDLAKIEAAAFDGTRMADDTVERSAVMMPVPTTSRVAVDALDRMAARTVPAVVALEVADAADRIIVATFPDVAARLVAAAAEHM